MMKMKLVFSVVLISLLFVVSSCGKPGQGQTSFAGQAIAGFSDGGCVAGKWWYQDGAGKLQGPFDGCTEYDSAGQPWCATKTVSKNGKPAYISGSKETTAWQYCAKSKTISLAVVSCAGGTTCDGTPVTGTDGQVVCGTDLQNWKCSAKGWVGQKDSCVCPTTSKPVTGYGGNPPCTDSDAQDFLTKGTVISAMYPQGKEDYCSEDGVYLFEGICNNNEYTSINLKCSESYGASAKCAEGKCVPPSTSGGSGSSSSSSGGGGGGYKKGSCIDSDNGKDYWTKGTLTTPKGEQFTDFCSKGAVGSSAAGIKVDSSDYVYEYYCFDDKTQSGGTEIVKCDGGCKDGKGSGGVCGEPKGVTGCSASSGGDALWKVGTSTKQYEKGKTIRDISTFIDADDFETLADGAWVTNQQPIFKYHQYLFFDDASGTSELVKSVNQNGMNGDYFFVQKDHQIAKYRLEFITTAHSSVTDSTGATDTNGGYLDDFMNTGLALFGKLYTVISAERPDTKSPDQSVKLTLQSGAQVIELRDDQITDNTGTYPLKLDGKDVPGTKVIISGTDTNETLTISTLEINMMAQQDYYVPMGGKLSEVISTAGNDKNVLLAGLLDISFKSMSGTVAEVYITHSKIDCPCNLATSISQCIFYKTTTYTFDACSGKMSIVPGPPCGKDYNGQNNSESVLVSTPNNKLEMANSNVSSSMIRGENIHDIYPSLSKDQLNALNDGGWVTKKQTFGYTQHLFFDSSSWGDTKAKTTNELVKYDRNDNDNVDADYFHIPSGRQIARYRMEFTTPASSDITNNEWASDAQGVYLNDFNGTKLNILGEAYNVISARREGTNGKGIPKSIILLLDRGNHLVEFRDNDITDNKAMYNLKVDSEDIDGTAVIISGVENNGKVSLNFIDVNMTAQDNYFVGVGKTLRDTITSKGDEKQILMDNLFDIEYKGLTSEKTHEIGLIKTSVKDYSLQLYDANDNKILSPIASATGAGKIALKADKESYTDGYGSVWTVKKVDESKIVVTQTAPTKNYDSIKPSDITLTLTGTADGQVRASLSGVVLKMPDGKQDVSYGYTSLGTALVYKQPINNPQELLLIYPQKQKLPQLYITAVK